MATLTHSGQIYTLITVRLKCLACGTLAESSGTHCRDFAECSCGAASIDGGVCPGATVNGNPYQMDDLSVYRSATGDLLPLSVVADQHARVRAMCSK